MNDNITNFIEAICFIVALALSVAAIVWCFDTTKADKEQDIIADHIMKDYK